MTEIWGKKGSFASIAMQFLSIYPNPLYIIRCKPNFPHLKTLLFKRSPFAFQNESFYSPKGVLLQSKTNPFTRQKESFCKTIGLHP